MPMTWRLRLALAALAWEGFWPAFWPVVAALLGFLVLASFDVLPVLPGLVHALLLLIGIGALGWGCYAGWRAAVLPDRQSARRRLERDSGLTHRPLEALGDKLSNAGDDPFAQALWAAHQARMAASTKRLRLAWPRTGLVRRDPYATRIGLALLLLIGLVAAGDDFAPRLLRALVPEFDKADAVAMTGVDLWINPPDYTGVPPIYLGTDAQRSNAGLDLTKPIAVPAGSAVLAQVHGGSRTPKLSLDGEATEFSALDASDFSATAKLGQAKRLTVTQGGSTLAGYDLQIIPDKPPTAEWVHPPVATSRGALRLEYLAKDDYGVKSLTLEIRRADGDEPPLEIQLPVSSQAKQELKGTTYQDLTPNPWAGLPVEMRLAARDAIDQAGISAPVKLTLPERKFRNPVAKAIIEQRKLLSQDSTQEDVVAETLEDLASRPALYRDDFTVFLALRAASERLRLEPGKAIVPGVQMLLWDTALKVEEGDQPEAQRSLREAEQALQDALDHNASDAEINKLTSQLRQAINRYLQAMIQNAMQNGAQPQEPQSGSQQSMTPDDIAKLLDQMQQMSQSGARDAAKEALAQLQDLLENLRAGPSQGQGDGQAQQLMRGMQELAKRQQQLLDKAYRQAQRNQNGSQGQQGQQGQPMGPGQQQGQGQQGQGQGQQGQGQSGESGDIAGAQSALRHQLDEMRRQLGQAGDQGEIGDALGRAERAMGNAVDALKKQSPGDAVGPQGEALDQLQQASRALAEQMRQNGQGGEGGAQAGRDPFGRNLPGQGDLDRGDVKIPEQSEMQRSREILDELRRRAGERARPQIERDYIDRLLKRF